MSAARLSRLTSLCVILVFFAVTTLPAFGDLSDRSEAVAAPVSVDISSLAPFFQTLAPDEKEEQLRDWALYGLKDALSLARPDELPVRHPALQASRPGEIAPGRVFAISGSEWGILAAPEILANKALVGGLVDKRHAAGNRLPDTLSLFSYTTDATAAAITVARAGSVKIGDVFSAEYGYYTAPVGTLPELERFIASIDDLTSIGWHSGRLVLGGRKYLDSAQRALTVQDVAGLYQAYNPPVVPADLQERLTQQRYEQLLKSDAGLQKALRRGKVKKAQVLRQIRRRMFPPLPEAQVGFSLDPQFDHAGLAAEIRNLAGQRTASLKSLDAPLAQVIAANRKELESIARRLETRHDLRPLYSLRRRLEVSTSKPELLLAATLQYFEGQHSYQSARYDGNLQGTSAAMILFYTDLLAKLWALDYHGSAPKGAVKGFCTMQEIPVPKTDWADFVRLSKTRLWFGLRTDGFDIFGDTLLFQPAVTRVYAASSDPMFPGKETLPNYQSREFLGWWDRHYQAVADVEPYYHKLDQIQKWGCVFMALKEKKLHQLDFLRGYRVRRDYDFEQWVKNAPVKGRVAIPFLDRQKFGRSTECLPLLKSLDYRMMGKYYALSGGVSLASRKDILAKLHKRPALEGAESHPALEMPEPGAAAGRRSARGGARGHADGRRAARSVPPSPAPPAVPSVVPAAGFPSAAGPGGAGHPPVEEEKKVYLKEPGPPAVASVEPRAEENRRIQESSAARGGRAVPAKDVRRSSGGGYGSFSAQKVAGGVKLTWEKGPMLAQHELVASLAALQQADRQGNRGEAIFAAADEVKSVVRVKEGEAYLVKTEASKGRWIYLAVNPAKQQEYPARAAAAFPEADIFCARLVSDAAAKRLSAGKRLVR